MDLIFFFLLSLVSVDAFAGKFALVIAGAPLDKKVYETGRSTSSAVLGLRTRGDYDVKFLIGDGVSDIAKSPFAKELIYINDIAKPDGAATIQEIDKQLANLVAKAQAGDQVELFLFGHGNVSDNSHRITAFGAAGNLEEYPTQKIFDALEILDRRGFTPRLFLNLVIRAFSISVHAT